MLHTTVESFRINAEQTRTWKDTFRCKKEAIPESNAEDRVIISDGDKGLIRAQREELPLAKYFTCSNHRKDKMKGSALRTYVKMVTATTVAQVNALRRELPRPARDYVGAVPDKIQFQAYARAAGVNLRGVTTQSHAESLNASNKANGIRGACPYSSLVRAVNSAHRRFAEAESACAAANGSELPPRVSRYLEELHSEAVTKKYVVKPDVNAETGRVIDERGTTFRVKVPPVRASLGAVNGECECGYTKMTGRLCVHLVYYMRQTNREPCNYVAEEDRIETWEDQMEAAGTFKVPSTLGLTRKRLGFPVVQAKQRGRPKKRRFLSWRERSNSRRGTQRRIGYLQAGRFQMQNEKGLGSFN